MLFSLKFSTDCLLARPCLDPLGELTMLLRSLCGFKNERGHYQYLANKSCLYRIGFYLVKINSWVPVMTTVHTSL